MTEPEELCCATYHVAVKSCVDDRPVDGAVVTIVGPTGSEQTYVGETDDTGTVTILVEELGDYLVTATHDNHGEKTVEDEAECGINNLDVVFEQTDKICFETVEIGGGPPPNTNYTVTLAGDPEADPPTEDDEIGSCETTAAALTGRCCVTIPGPGTYLLSTDGLGSNLPEEIVIREDDCGDKIIRVTLPGPVETCERTLLLNLCGCPAVGVGITVTLSPSSVTVGAVVDASGVATFEMTEGECEEWIGSSYEVDMPGSVTNLTGTVTSDGMVIPDPGSPSSNWCYPDCMDAWPATVFWHPTSWGPPIIDMTLNGTLVGLDVVYTNVLAYPCFVGGFPYFWNYRVTLTIPRAECIVGRSGTLRIETWGQPPGRCGHSPVDVTYEYFDGAGTPFCPMNMAVGGGTITE